MKSPKKIIETKIEDYVRNKLLPACYRASMLLLEHGCVDYEAYCRVVNVELGGKEVLPWNG